VLSDELRKWESVEHPAASNPRATGFEGNGNGARVTSVRDDGLGAMADARNRPDAAVIDYAAVAAFRSALRRFDQATSEITRRHGLTTRRYELLVMIHGAPGGSRNATVSELAERMHLALHTVTELVARTERAGLVRRSVDSADRRVTRVRLTHEGEARLGETAAALGPERQRLTRMLADVSQRARSFGGAA
jgi:DNA-binding MarR family transcriptional regulator